MKPTQRDLLTLVFFLSCITPLHAEFYRLTDLGVLPGRNSSSVSGINDAGQIVGESRTAFLWTRSGGMQDLGVLPGGSYSYANGTNDAGQVVGGSEAGVTSHAFLWTSSGGMQDLGVLPGHHRSYANDINDVGQVIGTSEPASFQFLQIHAFLWTSTGGMQNLGDLPLDIYSQARGINNAGQVVGQIDPGLAYVWSSTDGWQTLGLLSGHNYSAGSAINNAGQVVGTSYNSDTGSSRAFLWTSSGGMQNLGDLPGGYDNSQGLGINDAGCVVGVSYSAAGGRAMLWTSTEGLQDLNTLLDGSGAGWTLETANAINNAGQIVGGGSNPAGQFHAFLLTPVPPGDFNMDGLFDCADVDGLVGVIVAGTNDPVFDLTGDGNVDANDLTQWLANAGGFNLPSGNAYLPGDANLNGDVDGSDFGIWNANKFTSVAAWCSGDFNANGAVDGSDFGIWNANKFTSAATSAVPEPMSAVAILMAVGCMCFLRAVLRTQYSVPSTQAAQIGAMRLRWFSASC